MVAVNGSNHLSEHFTIGEPDMLATCRHCGAVTPNLSNALLLSAALEKFRANMGGNPITVASGYRCPAYQQELDAKAEASGVPHTGKGYHPLSLAADLTLPGYDPLKVRAAAILAGFGGCELKNGDIHLDLRCQSPAGGFTWFVDVRSR